MTELRYGDDHECEARGCHIPSPTARTCSSSCRSRLWKAEKSYRDFRRVRNAPPAPQKRRETRYAICQVEGASIHVLGFEEARDRRMVERNFGVGDVAELAVVSSAHLPVAA